MPDTEYTYLDELIKPLLQICDAASEKILDIYNSNFEVQTKSDASPVTDADFAANDIICHELEQLSDWPILSEEACDIDYDTRNQWSRYWLIDPLDGTRQFIRRNDGFTINIALIDNHIPVLGMVRKPVGGTSWYAHSHSPAYRLQAGQQAEVIRTRKPVSDIPVFAISSARRSETLSDTLDAMAHDTILAGSSIKSCLVAEGTADYYPCLGPTSEWDTAAAQVIVEQAGGIFCDLEGKPLRYNCKASLINPEFIVCGDAASSWQEWFGK